MRPSLAIIATSLFSVLGCTSQAEVAATSEEVTKEALEVALRQDAEISQNGYQLEGRIWASPDTFSSVYVDGQGNRTGVSSGNSQNPTVALKEPMRAGESFWEYVERVRPADGYRPVGESALGTNNVYFFAKADRKGASEVREASQAVVGKNDSCPPRRLPALDNL